ncbi:MAG: sodium-extruding oxaloacetate decarboxylase subunit alpha [Pseudomonadales bacterium]
MGQSDRLGITDVTLRDGHQSLLATRMRLEDMLPIAPKLDQVGFWSLETWGGATFDACIRYLGEDPWERIRALKKAMPNTPQQMLLRGQNLLGYRHYADDVVDRFVERSAANGVDVFRIFDAMNDVRNLSQAIAATRKVGKHAQGTISYTVSPVHTIDLWLELSQQIQDLGAHSICIKDMAGLLRPYVAEELVSRMKETLDIPVHMQCHATTGMSTATYLKAIEAGIDNVDTSISSLSMTYGHSPTESVVAVLENSPRATGLNLELLEEIAAYVREVRKKYARFEGSLKGIDSRILIAQVPGGMLTNLENQLREQQATNRMDEVLLEIPKVREELGYIPLVTPTSQIVGSQAVINVLSGQRYGTMTKETRGVLRGEYGATPAPVDAALQTKALDGDQAMTDRPADALAPEFASLRGELQSLAQAQGINLAEQVDDDVLIYALFARVGLDYLKNRNNPEAFEPLPGTEPTASSNLEPTPAAPAAASSYRVAVNGKEFSVVVAPDGSVAALPGVAQATPAAVSQSARDAAGGTPVTAALAGSVIKLLVAEGDTVASGQPLLVLEAMKMETNISASQAGVVQQVLVQAGDAVATGDTLMLLGAAH